MKKFYKDSVKKVSLFVQYAYCLYINSQDNDTSKRKNNLLRAPAKL